MQGLQDQISMGSWDMPAGPTHPLPRHLPRCVLLAPPCTGEGGFEHPLVCRSAQCRRELLWPPQELRDGTGLGVVPVTALPPQSAPCGNTQCCTQFALRVPGGLSPL
ncbi:hypothetical protein KIL84_001500 [Mauremys mutica]|uniref:Uncharacterized protein n=1 Tax=Mauremys mutica TaxID=74926 RepID=A0A9D3X0P0_9SAUR|nr:hypothetical protein KIL84_001500 [Mauremys mutica]